MSIDKIIASIPTKSDAARRKMRENATRWITSGTDAQKRQAGQLLEALDAQIMSERAKLNEVLSAMTLAARVVEAFRKQPPTPTEEKVIRALLDHPASTSTELSRACGWKGQIWHNRFGTMCKNREINLWPAEPSATRDANFYSGILADLNPEGNRFTMKPDVVRAFADLGIRAAEVPPGSSPGDK